MNEPWVLWCTAGLIVFAASLIQSAIGFGYGLIAVPLLLGIGFELPEVVALAVTTGAAQGIGFAWSMRRHVPWGRLRIPVVASASFLFVGIWTLGVIADQGRELGRQVVGGLLIALVLLRTLVHVKPQPHLHTGWDVLAGSASGFLGGMMSVGGPPIVLWAYAHDWTQQGLRSAVVGSTLPLVPIHVSLLFWRFGASIGKPLLIGVAFAPIVLLGMHLGLAIGRRFHVDLLRRIVTFALILMGLYYLLGPLFC